MPLDDTSAYNYREGRSTSLTFRLNESTVKKLRDEAQRQGISLNSCKSSIKKLSGMAYI